MFDISKIASINIEYLDLLDLLQEKTGNPIAEEQIPTLLKEAIKNGKPVYVTLGNDTAQLTLDEDGFKLVAK